MARLPSDPKLRALHLAIKEEVRRVSGLTREMTYVTYAIRDPSEIDHRGHPDGPRIYVGQSKQMHIRANDHMKEGGRATVGAKCKAREIYRILEKGVVPKFEVLENTETLLASLISETLWARRSVWLGYKLANQWREHRSREKPEGVKSVPSERYLEFTVAEAALDGVRVNLNCTSCGYDKPLDLETLEPQKRLGTIRKSSKCPSCGSANITVRPPVFWPKSAACS